MKFNQTFQYFWITFNNFSFQGFIRNIDIGRKAFVILTPLPFEKLINVNALLKGNIDIPLELIETVSSFIGNYLMPRHGATEALQQMEKG